MVSIPAFVRALPYSLHSLQWFRRPVRMARRRKRGCPRHPGRI